LLNQTRQEDDLFEDVVDIGGIIAGNRDTKVFQGVTRERRHVASGRIGARMGLNYCG
jgi:hypothetical protein